MTHLHYNHDNFYPPTDKSRPPNGEHRCAIRTGAYSNNGYNIIPMPVGDCVDYSLERVDCPDCFCKGLQDVEVELAANR